MFSEDARTAVEEFVVELARADDRVTAAAVVGSRARGPGDRWSDIDLTFAAPHEVLDEWTARLRAEFDATVLFDIAGPVTYRVFLLPGALQVDLSVSSPEDFAPRGDTWRLLFGTAGEPVPMPPRDNAETVGYAVHHAVRARVSIERGRAWQAEYWISGLRDEVVTLASRRAGVQDWHARGAHLLPDQERFAAALVRSLDVVELNRALAAAIGLLLAEVDVPAALAEELTGLMD